MGQDPKLDGRAEGGAFIGHVEFSQVSGLCARKYLTQEDNNAKFN
jgi:hypothetical protein